MLNYSKNSKLFTTEKKCNFLRVFSTPKFVRIYVFFKKIMGSTRSHPLPPGIFVKMPSPPLARSQPISAWYNEAETIVAPSEFDDWTEKDFDDEIDRLNKRLKELDSERVQVQATPEDDDEYDSDDIMNDPDVRKMVENGEHTSILIKETGDQ